jgi:tetratricopeptide (TPR) repeat protein
MTTVRLAAVLVALALAAPRAGQPAQSATERAYRANNIGVAQLEQFDHDAAAVSFREALKLNPSLAMARLNLAIALFYGGKPPEAAVEARAAVASLAASPHAHYVSGLIAKAEDRLDDAAVSFTRVAEIDPQDAGAKINLGQIHLQQRRYPEAVALFKEALAAEPYNVTAAYSVALAMIRAGQAEEGREAMQRFEKLRDSAYGVTYSQLYLSQGRYGEAIASTGDEPDLVNPAPPDVTFAQAFTSPAGVAAAAGSGARGGVTLFDKDGDGDLDLVEAGTSIRFLRNEDGKFVDHTKAAGLETFRGAPVAGVIAGDYDNDEKPDLLLLAGKGARLLHQEASGSFQDVTEKASLPQSGAASAGAFVDIDHDGDLDVVLASSAVQLLRNNGNGTFADVTKEAGLTVALQDAVGIAPTDYDNRRDIDMLVLAPNRMPVLYRNMRDGTFRDAAGEARLPAAAAFTALAAGDVNKDTYTDFFLARSDAPGTFAISDGRGAFQTVAGPDASTGALAAQFFDYDNDGVLDLLTLTPKQAHLFRGVGRGKWLDVTEQARLGTLKSGSGTFDAMALGDVDDDGSTDIVVRTNTGEVHAWRNQGGTNTSIRVRLTGRVSNRSGLGSKVEIRAGSLRQRLETSASAPAVAPADLRFGLGSRSSADVVRVLWPAGILQAETELPAATGRAHVINVTELDRKPSSCPYLFAWNGTRFEFVTDFMGGGEMGAWVGPRTWNQPDPDEYVRIRADQLKPRDGSYELRVTNELEEALFVDALALVAVDHPQGVEVFPNEGLRSAPRPPFRLFATRNARPPARVIDDHGHDVLPQLALLDRRYVDDFDLLPVRGYAAPHTLTLDLGTSSDDVVLLMTGWTDYAFSNDNVAASQHGASMQPPSVQVKDAAGHWQTVIDETGFPVGRPQTVPVSLKGKFLSASREVRIVTTMRIYWDQVLVDSSGGEFPTRMTRLDPSAATLRERGFSAETTPDGREPFGYDYDRVSATSPWKVLVGNYTRLGDVRALLTKSDDMFVVSRPGDEIALSFDAATLPALPAGWTRTFLLYSDGFSKEMNPRSASPDSVGPLPFHRMTQYPYGPSEAYPRTPAHGEYLERYNTRVVTRDVPSIDVYLKHSVAQPF